MPERIEQLETAFQAVWRRPPTDDERRAIIADFVREEVYYSEALVHLVAAALLILPRLHFADLEHAKPQTWTR